MALIMRLAELTIKVFRLKVKLNVANVFFINTFSAGAQPGGHGRS